MTVDRRRVYRQVAELHVRNIDQGFLSTLGVRFLSLLYATIDRSPAGILCTVERDGRVVGFVAGALRTRTIFNALLRRLPQVAWALAPVMFSPTKLRHIGETVFMASSEPLEGSLPAAELLSIAVDPQYRGRGLSEELYAALCTAFRQLGVDAFRILVGGQLAPAHAFYRRRGAEPVGTVEAHRGQPSTLYVHRLPA